jgi:hypothetical protein
MPSISDMGTRTRARRGGSTRNYVNILAGIVIGLVILGIASNPVGQEPQDLLQQLGEVQKPKRDLLKASDPVSKDNYDWPGVPIEEVGHILVKKGHNFVEKTRQLLLTHLDEFLDVYEQRPDKVNMCGIRINHAYALWLSCKVLKPKTIIESGVNAGQSTYFMRSAAPDAKIFAIDPLDKPICGQEKRWIDTTNAVYYTGDNFEDLATIDWGKRITSNEIDPSSTLVFLDDHLRVYDRFPALMKFGFRHVVLEDNYKKGEGATQPDKAGWCPKQMLARVDADSEYLFHNLISYAEFPPLIPPIMAKLNPKERKRAGGFLHPKDSNVDIVAPILRPDIEGNTIDQAIYQKIANKLGLDPKMEDNDSYMQFMNYNQFSYFELRPFAPHLRYTWKR